MPVLASKIGRRKPIAKAVSDKAAKPVEMFFLKKAIENKGNTVFGFYICSLQHSTNHEQM